MPVLNSIPEASETIALSAESQVSTIASPSTNTSPETWFWRVAVNAPAWVCFGVEPEAGPDQGYYLFSFGGEWDFAVSGPHEKCAVRLVDGP